MVLYIPPLLFLSSVCDIVLDVSRCAYVSFE